MFSCSELICRLLYNISRLFRCLDMKSPAYHMYQARQIFLLKIRYIYASDLKYSLFYAESFVQMFRLGSRVEFMKLLRFSLLKIYVLISFHYYY